VDEELEWVDDVEAADQGKDQVASEVTESAKQLQASELTLFGCSMWYSGFECEWDWGIKMSSSFN
jgi:hypothetical protein